MPSVWICQRLRCAGQGPPHGRALAHCEFRRGDMYALPFAAESFDTVTIDRVLALAERPLAVLAEAARELRPSGRRLVIESVDARGSGSEESSLICMRRWLGESGFGHGHLRPCDLTCGRYVDPGAIVMSTDEQSGQSPGCAE